MSETQKGKDAKIQDLPAKTVTREQGETVKGGVEPINDRKKPPRPVDPING
jgi:hypothetical protein